MKNLKKVIWATAILGLVICGFIAYTIYGSIFSPNTSFSNKEAYVYIASDASFVEVKEQLLPLLEDINSFDAVAQRKGYATNVKAGKYVIKKGMNNNNIINSLRSRNIPVKVSFNNQETLNALAGRVAEQLEADSISLAKALNASEFLNANGFNADTKLSMYIPNTYEFYWNTTAIEFRSKMLKEYKRFWNNNRIEKAKALGLSPTEVIALAAIVQKETAKVDERPKVAGLYLNRIKRGMFLQADPSVIYAIKKETGNYDTIIKRVLYKDLEINSPYNTYKNTGVPPGPITMPDISSIDGVLNAEKHDYLYMVSNISNFGYHMFAKSLSQHNRNKVQYIRWLNNQNIRR